MKTLNKLLLLGLSLDSKPKRKIVMEEFIRSMAGVLIWSYVVFVIGDRLFGGIRAEIGLPISVGLAVLQFLILVTLRVKTGWRLQLIHFRYLLILLLVAGIPVFIWRILEGEVIRAAASAGVLFILGLLLFIILRRMRTEQ